LALNIDTADYGKAASKERNKKGLCWQVLASALVKQAKTHIIHITQ